jgi:hypothetical protein
LNGKQELAQKAKPLGVCWNREKKLWELSDKEVMALGLEN